MQLLSKNTREDSIHLVVIIAQLIFKKLPDLVAPKNVVISKYEVFQVHFHIEKAAALSSHVSNKNLLIIGSFISQSISVQLKIV